MKFADLGLSDELMRAVTEAGYDEPTPIQAGAIPSVLMMRDLIGIAQTGTGKTASFVLPMIDILAHGRTRALMPRSLILEPTRELAAQVAENFEKYGKYHKLSMALLIGGVQMGDQVKALEKGVDVLIATPGRLMDLYERGKILLTGCNLLVIDEADRMLDMGFIPDIENICTKLPANRQTLLFSATMPAPIKKLADKFLSNPKTIEVSRPASTNANIVQFLVPTAERKKRETLRSLLRSENVTTGIIFCNRKTTVRELAKSLQRDRHLVGEIHGDMDQSSRIAELERFKRGDINLLVASDVAARGLDVKGVSHVFNFDAPWHPDDYVHRIGRTGRGGAKGRAFTLIAPSDAEAVDNIQKLTGSKIDILNIDEQAQEATPRATRGKSADRSRERDRDREREDERVSETPESREGEPQNGRRREPRREPERVRETAPEVAEQPAQDDSAARSARPKRAPRDEEANNGRRGRRNDARGSDGRDPNAVDGPDEGWNGPIPSFLFVGVPA